MGRRVIYYEDELNDEFSEAVITPRRIDGTYAYIRDGVFGRLGSIVGYYLLARPLGALGMKLRYHHRIVGRRKLKLAKDTGYFLYGNHTNAGADPFVPSYVTFPRKPYVIVHPNNVSIPIVGPLMHYLGALPLPDDRDAMKHFRDAIALRIDQKHPVVIYPEAHIWPYCTWIRPFKDASFHYQVEYGVPVYCFTNTYHKKKLGFGARMVTYVDGPFYPQRTDEQGVALASKVQRKILRDQVFHTMQQRAMENTLVLVEYVKKEQKYD